MAATDKKQSDSHVTDINAYVANACMNFAVATAATAALGMGKIWLGMLILLAMLYGFWAICLILASFYVYTIWTFEAPKTCHKTVSSSMNILLGRSWRVSSDHPTLRSNNNVSMARYKGLYIIAYRNADWHWPSKHASMIVATAENPAGPWTVEWRHKTGEDLREMFLFELKGTLFLFYCGINNGLLGTFNVEGTRCFVSSNGKDWQTPPGRETGLVSRLGELIWDVKVVQQEGHEPIVYKTSYLGGHYQATGDQMSVLFEQSSNALDWRPCGSSKDGIVYRGGISEVAFEFTARGDLVAIGRNEDGDATGFGSQLFFAHASDLGTWQALKVSLPWRFDSPRMVRTHDSGDILLFARYTYSRYDKVPKWLPRKLQEFGNIFIYSVRPKTAAIYRVTDPESWAGSSGPWTTCSPLELARFFEHGCATSDTGFFSLVPHPEIRDCWHVANYSAAAFSHAWWIYGQLTSSDIYVAEVRVEASKDRKLSES